VSSEPAVAAPRRELPRFPAGPPSLVACERLTVEGDVIFGRDVIVRGSVAIENSDDEPLRLDDGTVLEG